MEEVVFPQTKKLMQEVVEIRLHTDHNDPKLAERWRELQRKLTGKLALPIYVVVDPTDPSKVLGKLEGARQKSAWIEWLTPLAKPRKQP